mmetsp:Transcript_86735/g.265463  ORF Transcript_86735/g.265463 Transcript_86735/m.265463 type:complete len:200 (-) Transcript_86735:399-998(-)
MVLHQQGRRGLRQQALPRARHRAIIKHGHQELRIVSKGTRQAAVAARDAAAAGQHAAVAPLDEARIHRPQLGARPVRAEAPRLGVPVQPAQALGVGPRHGEARVVHTERLEDLAPEEVVQWEATDVFEHEAKDVVAVAVVELATRVLPQGQLRERLDEVGQGVDAPVVHRVREALVHPLPAAALPRQRVQARGDVGAHA